MTWNPTKEVAVARDAADALDDAPMCVVLWVNRDGEKLGMASYGKTQQLLVLRSGDELGHGE